MEWVKVFVVKVYRHEISQNVWQQETKATCREDWGKIIEEIAGQTKRVAQNSEDFQKISQFIFNQKFLQAIKNIPGELKYLKKTK